MNIHNKISRAFSVIVAATVLAGCEPVTAPGTTIEAGLGPFRGAWNQETWNGRGYAVLIDDTLHITGHRRPVSSQFYDETVRITIPFAGTGTYEVESGAAEMWEIVGGDAGYFASVSGEMRITRVDVAAKQIEGFLQLHGNGYGRPWSLTNVEFTLPIYSSFNEPPRLY